MDAPTSMAEVFHATLEKLEVRARRLAREKSIYTDWQLALRMDLPDTIKKDDKGTSIAYKTDSIVVEGVTPTIVLAFDLVMSVPKDKGKRLDATLISAMKVCKSMTRTLSLAPLASSISLREGSSKWIKAGKLKQRVMLSQRFFDESVTVTVTCNLTQETLTGTCKHSEIIETRDKLKYTLSQRALSDPAIAELVALIEESLASTKDELIARYRKLPMQARIITDKRGTDITLEYDSVSSEQAVSEQ